MTKIDDIDNQLMAIADKANEYMEKLSEQRSLIDKWTKSYDSLIAFKQMVISAQSNHEDLQSSAKASLSPLALKKKVCRCAGEYGQGMSRTLTNIGSHVVTLAFSGLVNLINIKLAWYKTKIDLANMSINSINSLMNDLDSQKKTLEDQKDQVH